MAFSSAKINDKASNSTVKTVTHCTPTHAASPPSLAHTQLSSHMTDTSDHLKNLEVLRMYIKKILVRSNFDFGEVGASKQQN